MIPNACLESDAEALVNTVNTVGVMGKGIALMFKERFALNMERYARACCKDKQVQIRCQGRAVGIVAFHIRILRTRVCSHIYGDRAA